MRFSNVEYSVVYVDPSRASGGSGATPADALKDLPATVADSTCYLIRRTADSAAATLPNISNSAVKNLMLLGMPIAADTMWELVPDAAKAAWGADTAAYANIGTTVSGCSLQLPSAQQFAMHRVHLRRDGVDAGAYLLRFSGSDGTGCFSFDHCKFGSKGVDIDDPSYTGAVTSARLCGYVSIQSARMLGVTDCVVNHGVCGYSSYGHGIYCRWADVLDVDNVRVFSPAATTSSQGFPLCLSDSSAEGIECAIRNVTQTVRLNGASGLYVPQLLSVQGYVSMTVRDIAVRTGTPLADARPSSYQVNNPLLNFQNVYELRADGIDLEYRDCWNCRSAAVQFSRCYTSTYVPGCDKHVRGLRVEMARTDGIGSPVSYNDAAQSGSSYAAVVLDFSSAQSSVFAKAVRAEGITVLHPRGKALHAESVRLADCEAEGTVSLKACAADIRSLKTWFPGKALFASEGTHVRVRRIECNTENPDYAYNEDPAVGSTFSDSGSVFADESNVPLRPMVQQSGSGTARPHQGFGCNSEGADGHFAYRCAAGLCDTWSVRRQGGGAAALKLSNNTASGAGTMVLGRRPFNGMQLLPASAGRMILRAHVAFKGFARPEELYRHLIISAETGGRTFWSTLHGRWADDADAVWLNDDALTQRVLEMPVDLADVQPVDVRVCYSWYASGGFVYLDPDIELAEVR